MKASEWPAHHYTASLADFLHVHDGDSFKVDLITFGGGRSPFRSTFRTYLRLINAYAPELRQLGGVETRDHVASLLAKATTLYVKTEFDRFSFNRVLCHTWADVVSDSDELVDVNAVVRQFVQDGGYDHGDTLRLILEKGG
jgi:hypothetical protein